jgi:hypothetical protein
MLYPEKWIAEYLANSVWDIKSQAFPIRESDNGCTWLLTRDEEHYIMQARPGRGDMGLWMQASELCTLVPCIFPTHGGSPSFHDLHWTWTIQEWRNGFPWPETWESTLNAGKALRVLHDSLIGLKGPGRSSLYSTFTDEDIRGIKCWAKVNRKNPWAGEVYTVAKMLPKMRTFYNRMEEVADRLPQQLVHVDYHPGNVLFGLKDDRVSTVVAILDLDLAMAPVVSAVEFAMDRFRFPMAFMEGYDYGFPQGGKIGQEWIKFEAVKRINWILRTNCLLGRNQWRLDLGKHVEKWLEPM